MRVRTQLVCSAVIWPRTTASRTGPALASSAETRTVMLVGSDSYAARGFDSGRGRSKQPNMKPSTAARTDSALSVPTWPKAIATRRRPRTMVPARRAAVRIASGSTAARAPSPTTMMVGALALVGGMTTGASSMAPRKDGVPRTAATRSTPLSATASIAPAPGLRSAKKGTTTTSAAESLGRPERVTRIGSDCHGVRSWHTAPLAPGCENTQRGGAEDVAA